MADEEECDRQDFALPTDELLSLLAHDPDEPKWTEQRLGAIGTGDEHSIQPEQLETFDTSNHTDKPGENQYALHWSTLNPSSSSAISYPSAYWTQGAARVTGQLTAARSTSIAASRARSTLLPTANPYVGAAPLVFDPSINYFAFLASQVCPGHSQVIAGIQTSQFIPLPGITQQAPPANQAAYQSQQLSTIDSSEPFPRKLYRMLLEVEGCGKQHIVSFTPSGNAFRVHDRKAFMETVAPHYFRLNKYNSFKRQLYLYDFQFVQDGEDAGSYYHRHFRRSHYDDLFKMRRVKSGYVVRKAARAKASSVDRKVGRHAQGTRKDPPSSSSSPAL